MSDLTVRSDNNSEAAAAAQSQQRRKWKHSTSHQTTAQHSASNYLTCPSDAECQSKHKTPLIQLCNKLIMISLQPFAAKSACAYCSA